MRERIEKLVAWGEKNGLEIDKDLFDIEAYEADIKNGYPVDHVFEEDLGCALREVGVGFELEQGVCPSDYLPEIVKSCFSLVKDAEIQNISVDSSDDWESASVQLTLEGAAESITIENVDNSDWIPDELWIALKKFSEEKLPKVLFPLRAGEAVNVIYLPSSEVAVLNELI